MGRASPKAAKAVRRERRKERRAPARIEVRFTAGSEAAAALRAYSLNFSVGGLCLRTEKTYPIGAELKLSLKLEKSNVELTGVVAWERRGAIGVRFVNLRPEDRERLERLVSSAAAGVNGC
jgi:uncharacterized protein (TIGR02266 family)